MLGFSSFPQGFALIMERAWGTVAEALDAAIALNGVAVEGNQQAFLLGRRYAVWPEKVLSMLPMSRAEDDEGNAVDFDLDAMIEDRASRLVDYQSSAFSNRYRADVAAIRTADAMADQEGSATHRVAEQLYRLMAIKDEYEVARLHLSTLDKAKEIFDNVEKVSFHLAPPMLGGLDANGRPKKRQFGPWMLRIFGVLSRLKVVRGTPFDPFGYTAERRVERGLIKQFESDFRTLSSAVDEKNVDLLVELALLPLSIRGFGPVKEANKEKAQQRRAQILDALKHAKSELQHAAE